MFNRTKMADILEDLRRDVADEERKTGVKAWRMSFKKLSEAIKNKTGIDISNTALWEYENPDGQKKMSVENLCALADYYGVSTDYLLGLTEVKTPDIEIQAINEKTGLSEESIDVISNFDSEKQKILSTIIENNDFKEILSEINEIVNQKSLYDKYTLETVERINGANENDMIEIIVGFNSMGAERSNAYSATNSKTINAKEYIEVLRYRLKNIFEGIIDKVTYSKDFNTSILDRFTQLFAADDNDPLYKLKIDILRMAQNGNVKKFLKEKLKDSTWSKA